MSGGGKVHRWLVAGSYPPVPGAPAAATVAAVRRAWARGDEVVVASPRPSAAAEVLSARGARLGRELSALAASHDCDGLVLCVEQGWPFTGGGRPRRAAGALAGALGGAGRAEVVVTGPVPDALLPAVAPLCAAAASVTASDEGLAHRLPAHPRLDVIDPWAGAGLRPAPGAKGAPGSGTVGPLEPGALLLAARARRFAGRAARAVLGRRAPVVRDALRRLVR